MMQPLIPNGLVYPSFTPNQAQHLNHSSQSHQPMPNLHSPNCLQCYPCQQTAPYYGNQFYPPQFAPQAFLPMAPYQQFNHSNADNVASYRDYREINVGNSNIAQAVNPNAMNHLNAMHPAQYNLQQQDLTVQQQATHYLPQQFYNPYMHFLPNYYTANATLMPNLLNNESQHLIQANPHAILNQPTTQKPSNPHLQNAQANTLNNLHQTNQANNLQTSVNQLAINQTGQQQDLLNAVNDQLQTTNTMGNLAAHQKAVNYEQTTNLLENPIVFNEQQLNSNGQFYTNYITNQATDYQQIIWPNQTIQTNSNNNTNEDSVSSHNLVTTENNGNSLTKTNFNSDLQPVEFKKNCL